MFNVCSGRPASAASWCARSARSRDVAIDHVVDRSLVRAHEVMEVRGRRAACGRSTGWEPEIALERTLADTVAWWREEIRAGRADARTHE